MIADACDCSSAPPYTCALLVCVTACYRTASVQALSDTAALIQRDVLCIHILLKLTSKPPAFPASLPTRLCLTV